MEFLCALFAWRISFWTFATEKKPHTHTRILNREHSVCKLKADFQKKKSSSKWICNTTSYNWSTHNFKVIFLLGARVRVCKFDVIRWKWKIEMAFSSWNFVLAALISNYLLSIRSIDVARQSVYRVAHHISACAVKNQIEHTKRCQPYSACQPKPKP